MVAVQQQGERNSYIKLLEFPSLALKQAKFMEIPIIPTCIRVSFDQQYLVVGTVDGHMIVYHILNSSKEHQMYEKYHPHSNKISDMVFIRGGKTDE